MNLKKIIISSIISAIFFAGALYGGYSLTKFLTTPTISQNQIASPTDKPVVKLVDSQSYCPLNGKEYTTQDQARWEQLRPVAVMIENHPDSRPQSGLQSADIIYEAVAEGGITRFMALYLCDEVPRFVGPVRSSRTYFLDWVSEYNSLYAHVGGANTPGPADALSQISTYGIKSINEIPLGRDSLTAGYQRIEDRLGRAVSLEHTMYLELIKLRNYAVEKFNWGVETDGARWDSTFVKWKYPSKELSVTSSSEKTKTISYDFWENMSGFNVEWQYDSSTNMYKRFMNDAPHLDNNSKQQIAINNVIVMVQKESRANDGYPGNLHLLYQTTGTGKAFILNNGIIIEGSWSKSGRTAKTKFLDKQGKEIVLERGKTWISVVPDYSESTIKIESRLSTPSVSVSPKASSAQ